MFERLIDFQCFDTFFINCFFGLQVLEFNWFFSVPRLGFSDNLGFDVFVVDVILLIEVCVFLHHFSFLFQNFAHVILFDLFGIIVFILAVRPGSFRMITGALMILVESHFKCIGLPHWVNRCRSMASYPYNGLLLLD